MKTNERIKSLAVAVETTINHVGLIDTDKADKDTLDHIVDLLFRAEDLWNAIGEKHDIIEDQSCSSCGGRIVDVSGDLLCSECDSEIIRRLEADGDYLNTKVAQWKESRND